MVLVLMLLGNMGNICYSAQKLAEKLNQEGEDAFRAGRLDEAKLYFKKALKADSFFATPYFNLGKVAEKEGKRELAIKYFKKGLEFEKENKEIQNILLKFKLDEAATAIKEKDYNKAIHIYEKVIEKEKFNTLLHVRLFLKLMTVYKKMDEKEKFNFYLNKIIEYAKRLKVQPEIIEVAYAYALLASQLFDKKEFFKAYECAKRAKDIIGKLKKVERVDLLNKTESLIKKVISSQNEYVLQWENAKQAMEQGRWQHAINIYRELTKRYNLGSRFDSVIKECNNRIKIEELKAEQAKFLAFAEQQEAAGQKKEAVKSLIKVIKAIREREDYGDTDPNLKKMVANLKARIEKIKNPPKVMSLEAIQKLEYFNVNAPSVSEELKSDYEMAMKYYNEGNYESAKAMFQMIVNKDKDYKDASMKLAECTIKAQRKKYWTYGLIVVSIVGLIAFIILAVHLHRGIPAWLKKTRLQKANNAKSAGNYNKAIYYYELLLKKSNLDIKESLKVHLGLAYSYLAISEYEKAISAAREALKIDTNNIQARIYIAKSYLGERSMTDMAIMEYRRLLELEPNNYDVLKILCEYYMQKEVVDKEAVDIYKRILKKEPHNAKVLEMLCTAYMDTGRLDGEAIALYEEILKISPERVEFRKMLAKAYSKKKMYEEVIKEIKFIFKTDVSDKELHEIFIDAYLNQNKISEVILEYEKLVEQYPENRYLQRTLDKLIEKRLVSPEYDKNVDASKFADVEETTKRLKKVTASLICPSCARMNKRGVEKCEFCGASLV